MRIGALLVERGETDALSNLADDVRRAADDGFSSAWISQIFGLDAQTALAVAGRDVPGIELGTGVVPTYPRHPAAMAQQARTTALALQGRFTLGIGLSHKIVIEDMYGYDFDRPLRHMDEYLSVLLPLLAGENASFKGETLQGHIGLSVPNEGRVPVLLAALGPKMLKLAAERTDGTVLWMTGPVTVREHVAPTITEAAKAAGRPEPRVVCALPLCVTNDVEEAREQAGRTFEVYGTLPSYRAMMDREGVDGPADLAIVGDEDTVASKLEELAEAGVTDFVANEYMPGESHGRTRAFLKSFMER
ncbi:F420-dependent oxidoreductase-like protein [Actinomadura hallensis]|uniref:F420-dependent oxidoreductase-like protein n=1 Tax=Actinomadura hallensis TaxID=337895 RepID=A0A543IGU3_9ACTN|nr:LLM class F420-dependent oxidoreductase [Actinomadura hallensis]MDA8371035.1 LLM class F420-dependent oxidoreductase [Nocardiopsaceae bacterium]TQM69804.1 F420-dependent oxidoreductase-like protein [Actinomadura hallensis]